MASADGANWQHNTNWVEQGRDDKYNFRDVCYGDGLFVAVGGGTGKWEDGSSCNIAGTRDGKTWNVQHPPGGWWGGGLDAGDVEAGWEGERVLQRCVSVFGPLANLSSQDDQARPRGNISVHSLRRDVEAPDE